MWSAPRLYLSTYRVEGVSAVQCGAIQWSELVGE
jgi:hypothetical protein